MARRIVVFGATGSTGRLVAERLAAQGERPVPAGRSQDKLDVPAGRLGGLDALQDGCAAAGLIAR